MQLYETTRLLESKDLSFKRSVVWRQKNSSKLKIHLISAANDSVFKKLKSEEKVWLNVCENCFLSFSFENILYLVLSFVYSSAKIIIKIVFFIATKIWQKVWHKIESKTTDNFPKIMLFDKWIMFLKIKC